MFAAFNTLKRQQKNSYAMHTVKITPNLLFEYQCTIDSVARIKLNRNILPELECSGR